jgi:hypothetical protein
MTLKSLALIVLATGLSGCLKHPPGSDMSDMARGRYGGIGTYPAGRMWRDIAATDAKDSAKAKLQDDEQIIVVTDTQTGEVRQCGNLSGYCVRMNPWSNTAAPAPVGMTIHADQLDAQAAAAEAKAPEAKP